MRISPNGLINANGHELKHVFPHLSITYLIYLVAGHFHIYLAVRFFLVCFLYNFGKICSCCQEISNIQQNILFLINVGTFRWYCETSKEATAPSSWDTLRANFYYRIWPKNIKGNRRCPVWNTVPATVIPGDYHQNITPAITAEQTRIIIILVGKRTDVYTVSSTVAY